jgi:hypothetical protein
MSELKRIAPIFPVRDLEASMRFYERLGFTTRLYTVSTGRCTSRPFADPVTPGFASPRCNSMPSRMAKP